MSVKSAGFPLPLVPARFRETAVEDPCVGRPVPREKARAFFASNATLWAATPIWMPFTPSSLKNKGVSCGESGPSLSVESPGDVRIGQHATARMVNLPAEYRGQFVDDARVYYGYDKRRVQSSPSWVTQLW
jgi:hypothetical protein